MLTGTLRLPTGHCRGPTYRSRARGTCSTRTNDFATSAGQRCRGTPVATILRPARTPKGTEVRTVIKHVTKHLRKHWPNTRIIWRGDSHYGRVEAMEWAQDDGDDYIFGLAGNTTLDALVAETADNLRFHHAKSKKTKLRTYASFTYQAGSWKQPRKVVARLECSLQPDAGDTTSTGMRQEVNYTGPQPSSLTNVPDSFSSYETNSARRRARSRSNAPLMKW